MGAEENRTWAREGASEGEAGEAPLAGELVGEGPLLVPPSGEAIGEKYYPLLLAPREAREEIFEE